MTKYLVAQDILVIHALIVDEIGGTHGLRDLHLLQSLVERPKSSFGGKEMYATVFEKAAVYVESLARYHVFVDGNKRTSIAVAGRFLWMNGYELIASDQDVELFVLRVAQKQVVWEDIIEWFKKNSKKS